MKWACIPPPCVYIKHKHIICNTHIVKLKVWSHASNKSLVLLTTQFIYSLSWATVSYYPLSIVTYVHIGLSLPLFLEEKTNQKRILDFTISVSITFSLATNSLLPRVHKHPYSPHFSLCWSLPCYLRKYFSPEIIPTPAHQQNILNT